MLVLLVGTGTDVGKTHVTCALASYARSRGQRVRAYKPIATGVDATAEDAALHARATGADYVEPTFAYRRPISPHLAAREEGRPIELAQIASRARELAEGVDLLLVESAGGLFSPLDDLLTVADLAKALQPDALVLVAPDRLGVLHEVRATSLAAASVGLPPALLVLSAPAIVDDSTGSNAGELERLGLGAVVARFPRAAFDAPESAEAAERLFAALRTPPSFAAPTVEAAIDVAAVGVVVHDAAVRIVYGNRRAAAILGVDEQALRGRSSFDPTWDARDPLGQPLPGQRHPSAVALRTGEVAAQIMNVARPDGTRAWLKVCAVPLVRGGAVVGVVVTFMDVSDEYERGDRAEHALSHSELRLASVVRSMNEGLVIHDPTGRIVYANPGAERILGLSLDQLAGRAAVDARWQLMDAAGAPLAPEAIPSEITAKTSLPCKSVPLSVRRGDGEVAFLSVSTDPIVAADGVLWGVVATFADVTELRRRQIALEQAHARLRAVLDAMPAVVYEYERDADGRERFPFATGRLLETLGIATTSGLTAERVWAGLHPDDLPRLAAETRHSLQELSTFAVEVRHRDPAHPERYRWLRVRSRPERLPSEDRVRWTGIILDVTEEHEISDALNRAQRREALGELAAGVAHNFNNMLAVILANVEEARGEVPSTISPLLDDALQATYRAADLVAQLLHIGRGGDARLARVDLVRAVREVLKLCRTTFGPSITLDADLEVAEAPVLGDLAHLQQVVLNLCLNARDAVARVSNPRVALRLAVAEGSVPATPGWPAPRPAERHYVLTVSDLGTGMDEATLARLGQPFFTTKGPRGTGLGLATALRTLRDMGAGWAVRSEVGRGTTFTLHFPVCEALPVAAQPAVASLPAGVRVLVVDDEPIVLQALSRVLEKAGARVVAVDSGDAALALLARESREASFDVVLLDLAMPGRPGDEVLAEIRARWPELGVVVLSGNLGAGAGLDAAHAQLRKPADRADILAGIARALAETRKHAR